MKKIFFLLASVILLACSENERMVYDEHMHDIYYSIVTDTGDDRRCEDVGKCIDQATEI